jgi:hypothetical protein
VRLTVVAFKEAFAQWQQQENYLPQDIGAIRCQRDADTRMDLHTWFATWTAQGKSALEECYPILACLFAAAPFLQV